MGNEVLNPHEVLELLNAEGSVKILVTLDEAGLPHPAVKSSLQSDGEHIIYLEFLESSRTNRYMIRSLWFDRMVSILVLSADERSYKITALPVRAIVNGKLFQRYYELAREKYGSPDLSTAWVLKPATVIEETLEKRTAEESKNRSYFLHLDRLAKDHRGAV
ncbi:MAG: hypothetical protein LBC51_00100 [Treponema sp.]|jgi:hypothetical protein|nr:hypothetical protein [Treponema sp.]